MRDELIRAAAATPVALLLPLGLPALQRRPARAAGAAGALMAAALAPSLDGWQAWVVVVAAAGAAALAATAGRGRPPALLAAAALVLVVAAAVTDSGAAGDALSAIAGRDVVIALAGAAACVFVGGGVIGRVLHPFALRIRDAETVSGLENAGRYIGWLERTLLYTLLLAGDPGAAALVVAGKSLARFPSFSEERFAEYYLIGTLLSLLIAAACALAARAAIGLHPLVPVS